ncbi:MAG: UDP-N-acetylmuramate dehydrogenase [Treponema sp.]|jgi:UDP-N-acetylmuramate dehydrogenase|nr:UDP-N-acetylmuramate dehydrogenase [Treponema sp.]
MNNILCIGDFFKTSNNYKGNVLFNEPLSPRTTFKIGANAALLLEPFSIDSFIFCISYLKSQNQIFFILGGGSNVVFPDDDYSGCIISTNKLSQISSVTTSTSISSSDKPLSELVHCDCGTPFSALINFCINNNLTGIEEFAGLPGTIGGATFMNARCFDKSLSDIIFSTTFYDIKKEKIFTEEFQSNQWDYKKSPFQQSEKIILSVILKLQKNQTSSEDIKNLCNHFTSERINKGHFKFPSAGSVFKNNRTFGKPTGQLIDEAGLKGLQIGQAQIASWHGNFIINKGKAKSSDVKALVNIAEEKVYNKFGFSIEPEIIFVDNI